MQTGIVIYVSDLARVSRFYTELLGLRAAHAEEGNLALEAGAFQLVLVLMPAELAATITIANPPDRREETPIKPIFEVPSIAAARAQAATLGGGINPPEREWQFLGYIVCDGYDPEGNVIQLREAVV